jgi:hypothetical protein
MAQSVLWGRSANVLWQLVQPWLGQSAWVVVVFPLMLSLWASRRTKTARKWLSAVGTRLTGWASQNNRHEEECGERIGIGRASILRGE